MPKKEIKIEEKEKIAFGKVINLFGPTESASKENFGRTDVGTPKFVFESIGGSDKFIKFGPNNDFPQEILRLLQNADAVHTAIIMKKVSMVASLGWTDIPALTEFIKNEYSKDDLNKIAKEVAFNAIVFGGFYLNLVWDDSGESIARIKSVPYEKVRVAIKEDESDDDCEDGYFISRDWLNKRKKENEPYYITAFDGRKTVEALEKRKLMPSQLLFVRLNPMGLDYYTLPTYQPVLSILKLSFEAWNYQLKSAQRSYQPNLIVTIPNVPPPLEREKIANDFKDKAGTDTAGDTVVLFGEDKDKLPEFTILQPSTNDQKFKDIFDKIDERVMAADSCNNIVAGIATEGKLGSSSEVLEQYQQYQLTVIGPLQKEIEDTFNKIAELNGLPKEMKLKNYFDYLKENINPQVKTVMHVIKK